MVLHPSSVYFLIKVWEKCSLAGFGTHWGKFGLKSRTCTQCPYSVLLNSAICLSSLRCQLTLQESPGLSLSSDWLNHARTKDKLHLPLASLRWNHIVPLAQLFLTVLTHSFLPCFGKACWSYCCPQSVNECVNVLISHRFPQFVVIIDPAATLTVKDYICEKNRSRGF